MTRRPTPLLALILICACGGSESASADASVATDSATDASPDAAAESCADELFAGTVLAPDGTLHDSCSPARTTGIEVVFSPAVPCVVAAARGVSSGGDATWTVGGRDAWFATAGPVQLEVFYAPTTSSSVCPPSASLGCEARGACDFDVTHAAHREGEVVEGTLVTPCPLMDFGSTGWNPTVTSLRFRAHISGVDVNDAGVICAPP